MKTIEKIKKINKELYKKLMNDGEVELFYNTGHSFGRGADGCPEWDYYSIIVYYNKETQEILISGKEYNTFTNCPQQFEDENSIFEAIEDL